MTVSPVDGRLYITDFMEKKIKRVRTMGPVPDLARNFDLVAGTGEICTPSEDRCGDGGLAVNAKLSYPKGKPLPLVLYFDGLRSIIFLFFYKMCIMIFSIYQVMEKYNIHSANIVFAASKRTPFGSFLYK